MVDPGAIRSRVADVNDGVLAMAGIAEGLGHLVTVESMPTIVLIVSLVGAVSVAGGRFIEESAEREVQQDLLREEARLIELSPEEEIQELADHYRAKGVSPATARQVAEELSAANALSAQLDTEYGIRNLMGPAQPWLAAAGSAVSFLLGAAVPFLISLVVPALWRDELILVGAAVSLTLTALVLSRFGQTRVLPTILRSLFIGAAAMGASIVAGVALGG